MLRFRNGVWERFEDGKWGPVDAIESRILEGFTSIDSSGVIRGPGGLTMTTAQFERQADPEIKEAVETSRADLSWWPPSIDKNNIDFDSVTGQLIFKPWSPSQQTAIFEATMRGDLPNDHLKDTKWEAVAADFREKEGAPSIGSKLFDEQGREIPGLLNIVDPDGTRRTINFKPPIDTGALDAPIATPIEGTDSVILAFSNGDVKVVSKAEADKAPTLAEQQATAFQEGNLDLVAQIGQVLRSPQNVEALITQELSKDTPEGNARAQQLFDFTNQTTKSEAMQLALKAATSPASSLAWSALVRGDLRSVSNITTGLAKTPEVEAAALDTFGTPQEAAAATQEIAEESISRVVEPVEEEVPFEEELLGARGVPPRPDQVPLVRESRQATIPHPTDEFEAVEAGRGIPPTPLRSTIPSLTQQVQNVGDVGPATPAPINQERPLTGMEDVERAFTNAGTPSQAPSPTAAAVAPTGIPTQVTEDPSRAFGGIQTPGGFEDIRVSPRTLDVATGRDVGPLDLNTAFKRLGEQIGIGPDFRAPSLAEFQRLTAREQDDLLAAAQIQGIDPRDFMRAIEANTPLPRASRIPRFATGGTRGPA